ncbi:MAG: hypothetical protein J6P93_05205, partial [Alphaproteobacteria bacterium]|nr:hypothetical protein [Alphaproteobacteria bacterium]
DGQCLPVLNDVTYFWGDVPKDDCEKIPNHYHFDGGCFYCRGTVNWTTGSCSTTTCHRNTGSHFIYGLDESTCTQCNGSFQMVDTENGKIGRCWRSSGWAQ